MNSNREKITNIVMVGVFAAVLAVLSQISFPLPSGIPVTLQTFAVALCGYALGCKRGTLAVLVYIVLGAVGLPVFSGFRSGVAALAGPTGGYILGFILCGGLYWLLEKRAKAWLLLAAGNVVCYIFGTAWFVYVYTSSGKPITFGAALLACVAPYVAPDAAKLALALLVSKRLSPHIKA